MPNRRHFYYKLFINFTSVSLSASTPLIGSFTDIPTVIRYLFIVILEPDGGGEESERVGEGSFYLVGPFVETCWSRNVRVTEVGDSRSGFLVCCGGEVADTTHRRRLGSWSVQSDKTLRRVTWTGGSSWAAHHEDVRRVARVAPRYRRRRLVWIWVQRCRLCLRYP